MIGSITFPLPSGGIARFRLEFIYNMHTDGSGVLKFNVVGTDSEFDFTCVDEGSAQRVLNYITRLQEAESTGNYNIDGNVNFASPTISNAYLIYEPLNNLWYLYALGTNMDNVTAIGFGGSQIDKDAGNSSSTNTQSVRLDGQPDFATYTLQLLDSFGEIMAESASFIFSVAVITCNPFPPGASATCTVNGSAGLVGGVGTTISFANFPDLSSPNAYVPAAVAPGTVTFIDATAATSPMLLWYESSAVIVSNYIKM